MRVLLDGAMLFTSKALQTAKDLFIKTEDRCWSVAQAEIKNSPRNALKTPKGFVALVIIVGIAFVRLVLRFVMTTKSVYLPSSLAKGQASPY